MNTIKMSSYALIKIKMIITMYQRVVMLVHKTLIKKKAKKCIKAYKAVDMQCFKMYKYMKKIHT